MKRSYGFIALGAVVAVLLSWRVIVPGEYRNSKRSAGTKPR